MIQDGRVGSLIRELADTMKAMRKPVVPHEESSPTPIDIEAALIAKYRDKPWPPLSAKALGKPTEHVRPLRDGSKWVLPA